MNQLNSLYSSNKNHTSRANNISKVSKQVAFGATLYQHVRDKALAGGAGGVATGTGFDLALGGSTLGANTAIGGLLGLIGGSLKGCLDYFFEKEREEAIQHNRRMEEEHARISKAINDLQTELRQRLKDEPPTVNQLAEETNRILAFGPNEIVDTETLEKLGIFGLGTIAGYQEDKIALKKAFVNPFINSMENKDLNEDVPNGVLLYGISGNGKTKMALALYEQALGNRVLSNIYKIEKSDADSVVYKLAAIKDKAGKKFKETGQRSIIFIDEIDAIIPKSGWKRNDDSESTKVKKLLDDCSKHGITVIATTSNPQNIDTEIIKDSNIFSVKTLIEPPSKQDIADILKSVLVLLDDSGRINFLELAEYIDAKAKKTGSSFSCKQIESIAREIDNVFMMKDYQFITKEPDNAVIKKGCTTQEDIKKVIDEFQPDISAKSLKKFKKDFAYVAGYPYEKYLEQKKSGNKN